MTEGATDSKPNLHSHLSYRPDIDGLRAIAVLMVMGDHFHTHLAGGYVGVDIFFVISGYLISANILKEMTQGTFSIAAFYERRIRRIFPALIVMFLGVSAMASYYLFPSEILDFARSMISALLSVSNLWFWHQSGYFDAPSASKPLLHTWSLGVEEQFYIFFPIFLLLVRKSFPQRLKAAILVATAISFGLAVYYVHRNASTAFFFSPLRAWELLIGTIVSQKYFPSLRSVWTRNLATASGLLMILIPGFVYTSSTTFPGMAAIPPCLGAALIIAGGETGTSVVGRLLSLRPVVFVGLISYSVYLWHWPVAVFQQVCGMMVPWQEHDHRLKILLFAVSLLLGYLSWRFVETPFRKGKHRPSTSLSYALNGAGVALLAAIALGLIWSRGAPQRFPIAALQVAAHLDDQKTVAFRAGVCFMDSTDDFANYDRSTCLPPPDGRPRLLLMGDSHAAQLWTNVSHVFPDVQVLQATVASCEMFLHQRPQSTKPCADMSQFLYGDYLLHNHIDAILFAGRWYSDDLPELTQDLKWMGQHGIQSYLVGPGMEFPEPFPRMLADAIRRGHPDSVKLKMLPDRKLLDARFAEATHDLSTVHYISYFDLLCEKGCPIYGAPGIPLLCDRDHLTEDGSILFAQAIRDRHLLHFQTQ